MKGKDSDRPIRDGWVHAVEPADGHAADPHYSSSGGNWVCFVCREKVRER